jgi:hypothetical protein
VAIYPKIAEEDPPSKQFEENFPLPNTAVDLDIVVISVTSFRGAANTFDSGRIRLGGACRLPTVRKKDRPDCTQKI